MPFDITLLPARYLATYGKEKVAEVLGEKVHVVAMWEKSNRFPLSAVQKLLEFDPAPFHESTPLYTNPEPGDHMALLVPLSTPPEPKMMDSLMKLYDPSYMAYQRFSFNQLSVARNALAAWALRRNFQWLCWMDGDNILPCGDAAWFKDACHLPDMPDVFAGLHAFNRMRAHKIKKGKADATIVSCCYPARNAGAQPQFGGINGTDVRALARRGPRDELGEVTWAGFGGMLTHRSVFDDIIRTQGDEIRMKPDGIGKRFGYEYGFFDPMDCEMPGDDLPFCIRARRAGHKIHVDFSVMSGHGSGDRPFTYKDVK